MAKQRKKKTLRRKKGIDQRFKLKVYVIVLMFVLVSITYFLTLATNVNISSKHCYFYIPDASTTESVYDSLIGKGLLSYPFTFRVMTKCMQWEKPRKGLYRLERGWGNFSLLRELKQGELMPYISYKVPSLRSRSAIVKEVCESTGANENDFMDFLTNPVHVKDLGGFTPESVYCIFIPGIYKIHKGKSTENILDAIYSQYCLYWNETRRQRAKELGYSPQQLTILASIVYAETKNMEEMPIIAGLYFNRLKNNMRLEADPTVIFATGTFNARRVYKKHTANTSLYNTYRHNGLPPGPVGPTPVAALEAVLHPSEHDYLFFCASDQASGCHIFTNNFEDHKKNAQRYWKVLNKKNIK